MTTTKYRESVQASGVLEIEHPGRYFTMLRAVSPVDLAFMREYRVQDTATGVEAGLWIEPMGGYDRVRVSNPEPYPVTVEFVLSDGRVGWSAPAPSVQKYMFDLSGVAASAFVRGPVIDLGEEWASVSFSAFLLGVTASAGSVLSIRCADSDAMIEKSLAVSAFEAYVQAYQTYGSTNGYMSAMVPTGRYVQVEYQNGATVQGAGGKMGFIVTRNLLK